MKKRIFTYGSLILPSCPLRLIPLESVFLKEYKLLIEKQTKSKNNYHLIFLQHTGNPDDIIAGYLAEIEERELSTLDKYEGAQYKRISVTVYKRSLEKITAYVYIKA